MIMMMISRIPFSQGLLLFVLPFVIHQSFVLSQLSPSNINLGSFSLQRSPSTGDLQLGIGNGANLFGFGADRQFGLNLGRGSFGTQIDNGLLIGGQRFGVDSRLGYQQGRGIDLGSILNLFQPIGSQFVSNPPSFSPSRRPIRTQQLQHPPIPEHEQRNNEESFPPSVGIGWENGEKQQKRAEPLDDGRTEEVSAETLIRDNEQREIGGADEKKAKGGKGEGKLPILTGLEPLTNNKLA